MSPKNPRKPIEEFIDLAMSKQMICSSCQTYESEDPDGIRTIQRTMPEVLKGLRVPKKYWEGVASSLTCFSCGTPLNITCDVGTKTNEERREERRQDKLWNSWSKSYQLKFKEFAEHIEKYPYLGLAHALGNEIFKDIEHLAKHSIPQSSWFRGRRVENHTVQKPKDLFPPDPKRVAIPEGRFNHFGQCVFYLSKTKEGAAREVLSKDGGLAWVQEFKIDTISDIVDLSSGLINTPPGDISALRFGLGYTKALARPVERTDGWKPEYFVPRFLADCLKRVGVKGIIFRSPYHYSDNLVLFQYEDGDVTSVNEPSLFTIKKGQGPNSPFMNL